ncbi:hypothetical protein EDD86DRAFT_269949 [Gorgonomyces haynaldii]|nr:hypothetical protein EDD86DRAFT_269949 [Gorgonomyces haynaldii]
MNFLSQGDLCQFYKEFERESQKSSISWGSTSYLVYFRLNQAEIPPEWNSWQNTLSHLDLMDSGNQDYLLLGLYLSQNNPLLHSTIQDIQSWTKTQKEVGWLKDCNVPLWMNAFTHYNLRLRPPVFESQLTLALEIVEHLERIRLDHLKEFRQKKQDPKLSQTLSTFYNTFMEFIDIKPSVALMNLEFLQIYANQLSLSWFTDTFLNSLLKTQDAMPLVLQYCQLAPKGTDFSRFDAFFKNGNQQELLLAWISILPKALNPQMTMLPQLSTVQPNDLFYRSFAQALLDFDRSQELSLAFLKNDQLGFKDLVRVSEMYYYVSQQMHQRQSVLLNAQKRQSWTPCLLAINETLYSDMIHLTGDQSTPTSVYALLGVVRWMTESKQSIPLLQDKQQQLIQRAVLVDSPEQALYLATDILDYPLEWNPSLSGFYLKAMEGLARDRRALGAVLDGTEDKQSQEELWGRSSPFYLYLGKTCQELSRLITLLLVKDTETVLQGFEILLDQSRKVYLMRHLVQFQGFFKTWLFSTMVLVQPVLQADKAIGQAFYCVIYQIYANIIFQDYASSTLDQQLQQLMELVPKDRIISLLESMKPQTFFYLQQSCRFLPRLSLDHVQALYDDIQPLLKDQKDKLLYQMSHNVIHALLGHTQFYQKICPEYFESLLEMKDMPFVQKNYANAIKGLANERDGLSHSLQQTTIQAIDLLVKKIEHKAEKEESIQDIRIPVNILYIMRQQQLLLVLFHTTSSIHVRLLPYLLDQIERVMLEGPQLGVVRDIEKSLIWKQLYDLISDPNDIDYSRRNLLGMWYLSMHMRARDITPLKQPPLKLNAKL